MSVKYILIRSKESYSGGYDRRREDEVYKFSTEAEVVKYIGGYKNDVKNISVFTVGEALSASALLGDFERKKALALSKLTDEDKVILNIR